MPQKLLILDARSYTAAVANRAKGGGCECEGEGSQTLDGAKAARVVFVDIYCHVFLFFFYSTYNVSQWHFLSFEK